MTNRAALRGWVLAKGFPSKSARQCARTLLKPAATLSRRASEEMETLAAEATVDQDGTVLRTARNGCEWWTYAGLKGNAALAREFALPCTFDSMCVRAHCSP